MPIDSARREPPPPEPTAAAVTAAEVIAIVERQWPRVVATRPVAARGAGPPSPGASNEAAPRAADSATNPDAAPAPLDDLARRLARAYDLAEDVARGEIDAVRGRLLVAHRARDAARRS